MNAPTLENVRETFELYTLQFAERRRLSKELRLYPESEVLSMCLMFAIADCDECEKEIEAWGTEEIVLTLPHEEMEVAA